MAYQTTPYRNTALKATATLVKAGRGAVTGLHVFNLDSSVTYLQFFDKAATTDVTVGTTVPDREFVVPSNPGWIDTWVATGQQLEDGLFTFTRGLVVAASTAAGGNTAQTNGLHVNVETI